MRINPISLMAMILLMVFTVVLALLTVVKSNQVRTYLEGDPENSAFRTNAKLKEEMNQLQKRIVDADAGAALRQREIDRLDRQLDQSRVHFSGDRLLAGITLPPSDELKDNPLTALAGQKDTPWKFTSDRVSNAVKRLDNEKAKVESRDFQDTTALDEAIRKRQGDLQEVTKRISDDEAMFARDHDDLTKRLDDINATREKAEKQHREDYSRRATNVSKLEDEIGKLLELELKWVTEIEADGTITESAASKVIIDIGAREKVFAGLLLAVFNHERGRYVAKGMVEVIEVRDNIAICRILRQDDPKLYPIGRGDSVGNPVFDARSPKTFFVAGEFKSYNKEDIESFIRATGGVVATTLGPNCDFLVCGERSDPERAAARQFQIQAMTEDQLLSFVQKTFAPRAAPAAK